MFFKQRFCRNTDMPILVCIPAFNEEHVIDKVIKNCQKYADQVVVCDDGSDDKTSEVADAAGVNLAMRKGANYPQGTLEWAEQWGFSSVVETLENLRVIYGERYQISNWLLQKAKIH